MTKKYLSYRIMVLGIVVLFVGMNILSSNARVIEEKSFIPNFGGNTLYVGGNGPGNFSRIQDAIDNASAGDTIFVFDDSSPYYENVRINKRISLIGENKESTIIDGNASGDVISIISDEATISGFTIHNSGDTGWPDFDAGIDILSDFNTIEGNIITNNLEGIYIYEACYNNISNNTISTNENAFFAFTQVNNNMFSKNNIIDNNVYGIYIVNRCENNIISFNTIENNGEGITLLSSSHNTITENTILNSNSSGIELAVRSDYNLISENIIAENNGHGIVSAIIFENNFTRNIVMDNGGYGVYMHHAPHNYFIDNNFSNNRYGFFLEGSCNNTIVRNNITNHDEYGICLVYCDPQYSSFNKIYHNRFINNNQNAYDECTNTWDNDYPSGGNYWDDYNGFDTDGDGIGDTPYDIPGGNNKDRFPLGYFCEDEEPPDIEIISPQEDFLYIFNNEVKPFFVTLIIGSIDIEVNTSDNHSGINRVEFYIDDVLKANVTIAPYNWTWKRAFFKHTIRVVAFDNMGNHAGDEIVVWKFF